MSITAERVDIPKTDKSRLPVSSKETRTKAVTANAIKAVEGLVYLANNPAEGRNSDQLAVQFKEKVGRWGNDEAAVSAINRFVHTYRTYVETFKQNYVPELSLRYLQSISHRRKGEGLDVFLDDICHDVEEGGDAWKSAGRALGDSDRLEKLFGGNATYVEGMMLGALVDGYLGATGRLSVAEKEEDIAEALKVRGRYIMAISRVYGSMPVAHKLGRGKVGGALQTIAEGLGVWEAPEH